jgi:hypothetical protein
MGGRMFHVLHCCPMCYVLHATKWVFLGNSMILAAAGGCSMCYMLQILGGKLKR